MLMEFRASNEVRNFFVATIKVKIHTSVAH